MKRQTGILNTLVKGCQTMVLTGLFLACVPAHAETPTNVTPLALQQALSSNNSTNLYTPREKNGFNLSSSYFSGLASGVTAADSVADVNNEQRLYALLIDGRYDFNHEAPALSSPLHPYVSAGLGMATAGQPGASSNLTSPGGNAVPLFRLGGGVAYRLDQRWNMSLNYEAGRATPSGGDQLFTGRGNQPVDLQQLNLGMSFDF